MSVKLTIIKTGNEHWERSIGYPEEGIQFQFSKEHEVACNEETVSVYVQKNSELFRAFNLNLKRVYHMGLERAGQIVANTLDTTGLSPKQRAALLAKILDGLAKENFSINS